ncbi:trypsin-like peptidase domain-containing protein [soil metagenome]
MRDQLHNSGDVPNTTKARPLQRLRLGVRKIAKYGKTLLLILIALLAGYIGSAVEGHGSVNTNTLTGQKQIVTGQGQLINKIAKDVGPSVVSITVMTKTATGIFGFSGQTTEQQGAGTGIIISKDGIIMTNRHVVPAGTSNVSVTLADGTQYDNIEVLGRTSDNDSLDLAFVKIKDLNGRTLVPAVIGDSSSAKVGDSVVAIGNALGEFQNTVTSGIISGFGRQVQAGSDNSGFTTATTEDLGNLIQTDAAINEGNSGGPLVNMNGQVIGINTAIADDAENIGFTIPINDVRALINQVLKTGSFDRPFLGVRYVSLTQAIAEEYALSVQSGAYLAPSSVSGSNPVVAGGPADKAGVQSGDIITSVNDVKLDQQTSLTTALNRYKAGSRLQLKVVRDGRTVTIVVTLGKMSASAD